MTKDTNCFADGGSFLMVEVSDQFIAGEKISKLKCSGFGRIRTVRTIVSDASAEVASNRSRRSFRRVGGAHRIAPLQNRAFGFKSEHHHLAGTHELCQFSKKG